jgi:hypothetical protein
MPGTPLLSRAVDLTKLPPSLEKLMLGWNQLTGPVDLTQLRVDGNQLTGARVLLLQLGLRTPGTDVPLPCTVPRSRCTRSPGEEQRCVSVWM